MSVATAYATVTAQARACSNCGACSSRCEVLEAPLPERARTVGQIARAFADACQEAPDEEERLNAVRQLAEREADLAFAIRRCCMCSYCTLACPDGVNARATFAALRELLSLAGVTGRAGFESTQVDADWHIFSVYRAVYGIAFVDLPHLEHARELGADTLFFPGCPLASYAPELTRDVFAWLADQGMRAVISEACCGSPLKSAGYGERARAFKARLAEEIVAAGIERVVCACPGCVHELREVPGMDQVEFVALPRLLAEAGVRIDPAALADATGAKDDSPRGPRVAVVDSCNDRDGMFGKPLRALLPAEALGELEHAGAQAQCCGAGGAVSLVDPDLSVRRAQRLFDEGDRAQADLLVTNCPTCAYTLAYHRYSQGCPADGSNGGIPHRTYLELAFGRGFAWDDVFARLEGMWSGEYGPWVIQQLT